MKYIFGPSTGETGQYGVGDIVSGNESDVEWDDELEGFKIKGEPVYGVYEINNGVVETFGII